ncbi:MAG: DivIVA domain-containing protein [Defluviitaleaceae bacterium]|nr:DivIVA domain-containing protein [Defluviitaleaceae bacterium]
MEKLFNIVKRGYDQDEVDQYLAELEETVKSYKEKDNSIKNAIINAQISADNIIKNAEIEADRIKKRAVRLLDDIQASINNQKQMTRDFQDEYSKLLNKYMHNISETDSNKIMGCITELEEYLKTMQQSHNSAAPDITHPGNLPKLVAGSPIPATAPDPAPAHPAAMPAAAPPSADTTNDTVAQVAELLAKNNDSN